MSYTSYLVLIVFGHIRDFFGKRFRSASYAHLMPHDVSDASPRPLLKISWTCSNLISGVRRAQL
jgi:serine palmitoyltransferase